MKTPDGSIVYIAGSIQDGRPQNLREIHEPMEVESVGTGLMLIMRKVLHEVEDPWFTIVDYKDTGVMPEDFEFCRKAREKGIKVALDSRINTEHWGNLNWQHKARGDE